MILLYAGLFIFYVGRAVVWGHYEQYSRPHTPPPQKKGVAHPYICVYFTINGRFSPIQAPKNNGPAMEGRGPGNCPFTQLWISRNR